MRLAWSSGGFPASAPIVRRKNSVAGCELGMLSEIQSYSVHVSKPDSGLHERPCRERDGDHVSKMKTVCFLRVRVASSSHRSERWFRVLISSSNMSSYFGGRRWPNIISLRFGLNYTCGVLRSFNYSVFRGVCSRNRCGGPSLMTHHTIDNYSSCVGLSCSGLRIASSMARASPAGIPSQRTA